MNIKNSKFKVWTLNFVQGEGVLATLRKRTELKFVAGWMTLEDEFV